MPFLIPKKKKLAFTLLINHGQPPKILCSVLRDEKDVTAFTGSS